MENQKQDKVSSQSRI